MAQTTSIEWTQASWNPITGCNKISAGCRNCYAERMAMRLKAMGKPQYRNGFSLTTHPEMLNCPYHWKRPRMVFVNSMSDLFHEDVPLHFIQSIFKVMRECSQHTFQILTKRPNIALEHSPHLEWTGNIWMGTTIENRQVISRIKELRKIPARLRFLSIEPLLGPVGRLSLVNIDWVIVGGESGPRSRPMKVEWVRTIRDQCVSRGIPFFFKQWGGTNKKKAGRVLDGEIWDEMPDLALQS